MALIKCPECGGNVSDKAPACIHCGFPLSEMNHERADTALTQKPIACDIVFKGFQNITAKFDYSTTIKNYLSQQLMIPQADAQKIISSPPQNILTGIEEKKAAWLKEYLSQYQCIVEVIKTTSELNSQNNNRISNDLFNSDGTVNILLSKSGRSKLGVINLIREETGLGLREAKEIVDYPPKVIMKNIPIEKAKKLVGQFASLGAEVSLLGENGSRNYDTKEVPLSCPRCGSTSVTTGARGYSIVTGFLGSNKTTNRCGKCGHSWQPR